MGGTIEAHLSCGFVGSEELVVNVGSQTQAALSSICASLQHISAEVISLREQLRRPGVKRRKVCMYIEFTSCSKCPIYFLLNKTFTSMCVASCNVSISFP